MSKIIVSDIDKVPREIRETLEGKVDSFKLENFGFGKWMYEDVRSGIEAGFHPDNPDSRYPWIIKPFLDDMSQFDCFESAIAVNRTLEGSKLHLKGFYSDIGVNSDMFGIFGRHFFNVIQWGGYNYKLVVDGVPIFPFYGARHGTDTIWDNGYSDGFIGSRAISFNAAPPMTTAKDNGSIYISSIRICSPLMQYVSERFFNGRDTKKIPDMLDSADIEMAYSIASLEEGVAKKYHLILKMDYLRFMKSIEHFKLEFKKLDGNSVFTLLLREGIVMEKNGLSSSVFLDCLKKQRNTEHEIINLRRVERFSIFQEDKRHIGNYAKACLLNYQYKIY